MCHRRSAIIFWELWKLLSSFSSFFLSSFSVWLRFLRCATRRIRRFRWHLAWHPAFHRDLLWLRRRSRIRLLKHEHLQNMAGENRRKQEKTGKMRKNGENSPFWKIFEDQWDWQIGLFSFMTGRSGAGGICELTLVDLWAESIQAIEIKFDSVFLKERPGALGNLSNLSRKDDTDILFSFWLRKDRRSSLHFLAGMLSTGANAILLPWGRC